MNYLFKIFTLLLALITFVSSHAIAQNYDNEHAEEQNLKVPAEWQVRLDSPSDDVTIGDDPDQADIYFVNMSPGWHITTGPRAIFYRPDIRAEAPFRATTKIHLFDPKGRNEAFGLFVGGQNLQQHNQTYTYFLLRNSGEYLIKKRKGADTELVVNWTKAPMMVQYEDTSKSSVANTLSIEVGETQSHFFVNGEKVHALPNSQLDTKGSVGLRATFAISWLGRAAMP